MSNFVAMHTTSDTYKMLTCAFHKVMMCAVQVYRTLGGWGSHAAISLCVALPHLLPLSLKLAHQLVRAPPSVATTAWTVHQHWCVVSLACTLE